MDKKRIERIASETNDSFGLDEKTAIEFATRFLARIDTERGNDARTLRMAAEICIDLGDDSSDLDSRTLTACARELRAKADELAKAGATEKQS